MNEYITGPTGSLTVTPEDIRVKLGLQPFDEFYEEQAQRNWEQCRAESGYNARKREHTKKYGWKTAFCQKCLRTLPGFEHVKPRVYTKKHARWCSYRGLGHVAHKQYVIARKKQRDWVFDPRRTGRTTQALIELLSGATEGKSGLYITHTKRFALHCQRALEDMQHVLGLKCLATNTDVVSVDTLVAGMRYDSVKLDHELYNHPRLYKRAKETRDYLEALGANQDN